MKQAKLFVGALLMMATLIACEDAVAPPPVEELHTICFGDDCRSVDEWWPLSAEGSDGTLKSSTAACIQPTISLGALTPTAGINELIRAVVLSNPPATHWMYGQIEIADSGRTTRKAWYVFGPGDSVARTAPAHYARGEATAGRTVSFRILSATAMRAVPDAAGIYRDGTPCFSTRAKSVRIAVPPPVPEGPAVIEAAAATAEVPPTTGGVERRVPSRSRMEWARRQWTDEDTPTDPPVWLYQQSGLYADGKWHRLAVGGRGITQLYVAPSKLGPREMMSSFYSSINPQTCRLFVDTKGRVLRGEFLNARAFRSYHRPDIIQGTQAAPHVFEFDAWGDTLVVNGGQTLNVAMICRDSWQG